jgi:ABC-2 type transport system permease protein
VFQQLITISRHTFTESIRQPIFVVLIVTALLALVLNPSLAAYSLDDDNKLLVDLGFSTLFLTGLLMAVFTATGVLSQEVETKTALTVISKPVARPLFVLGKYLGVGAAITVAFWALSAVFLLTIRHRVMQTATDSFDGPVLVFATTALLGALVMAMLGNYFYQRSFASGFVIGLAGAMTAAWVLVLLIDKQWQFQSPMTDLDPQMMAGLLLVFEGILVLTAVAIAASTRLGQTTTLIVCVLGFVLGLLNEHIFGGLAQRYVMARVFYLATPNIHLYWSADALTQGVGISARYVGLVTGYTLLYVTALMGLAVGLFQRREIG